MKNINVCFLAAVACTYSIQASANSLDNNLNFTLENNVYSLHAPSAASHTVTPLELEPILPFYSGIKFAAVCALAKGGCDGMGFSSSNNDINLDNNAQCKDEGFGTTCGYGSVPDTSQKCPYNNAFFKCRVCSHTCSSGSLNYCSSDQIETGSSRNDCNETCYTCRMKSCEEGGYTSSINSCQKASAVSFAGKTCYTSIAGKSCADGGYSASIPTNNTCSSTSYCGNTCYHSCSQPTCAVGGFKDAIPANNACTSTTYYGRNCYKDCYQPNCGAGGYNASIPANNLCSAVNYYGQTCYKDCYQPACSAGGFEASVPSGKACTNVSYYGRSCYTNCKSNSCPSGYNSPSCNANQVQTGITTTESGTPCYACRAKTCNDGGYVNACPTNQIGTSVSYAGLTCYSGCNQPACSSGGFVDVCPTNQIGTAVSHYGRTCYKDCYQPACSSGGYYSSIPAHETCTPISYYGRTCYKDCKLDAPIYVACSSNADCAGSGMKVCQNPGTGSSYCTCYGEQYSSSSELSCSGICKRPCYGTPKLSECSLRCYYSDLEARI